MFEVNTPIGLEGEVGNVETCVAEVNSRFRKAAKLLKRIKGKRESYQAWPLPEGLEDSIGRAIDDIEKEDLRGIVQFGRLFEEGDAFAISALQQVATHLRNSLLEQIDNNEDGEMDDAAIVLAVEAGRDNTIHALIELRLRLSTTASSSPVYGASTLLVSTSDPTLPLTRTTTSPPALPLDAHNSAPSGPPPNQPLRSSSLVRKTSHSRPLRARLVVLNKVEGTNGREVRATSVLLDKPHGGPLASNPVVTPPSSSHREAEDGQVATASPISSPESNARKSSVSSIQRSASTKTSVSTLPGPTSNNTHDVFGSSITTSATVQWFSPGRGNNYLGFCKTAWKLQNGDDKAMIKSKDYSQSAQSKYHFLTCSKFGCKFRGQGQAVINNNVVTDANRGLKYRWAFLAKSHVMTKSMKNSEYAYLCVFCVYLGEQAPCMNVAALLDHISHKHRGSDLNAAILERTRCASDRICKDSEKFDINLYPLGVKTPAEFEPGTVPIRWISEHRTRPKGFR
ncbi:hypothetical protein LTR37_011257 [Vermiconidia calcicola]|uniref:Uncharacterized protein n=1 Tax=Vermiconidia calcicola TaxID=1690605 RepID=A0ACC3N355_9PEZI|nr:hypothetical protein LTR37_011257 [Vermiconidia calcicola]